MESLAVFDFDNTLKTFEKGNFTWGVSPLFPGGKFQEELMAKLKEIPWDEFRILLTEEFNKLENITKKEIEETVSKDGQIIKNMDKVIKTLAKDHDVIIVTNSYEFHVKYFLVGHGIAQYVSKIICVPAEVSEDGKIIRGDVPQTLKACSTCNFSFCKSLAMKSFIGVKNYESIKYFGDGKNDFCPCLTLKSSKDAIFPRKDFALMKLISPIQTDAGIYPWNDGSDILALI